MAERSIYVTPPTYTCSLDGTRTFSAECAVCQQVTCIACRIKSGATCGHEPMPNSGPASLVSTKGRSATTRQPSRNINPPMRTAHLQRATGVPSMFRVGDRVRVTSVSSQWNGSVGTVAFKASRNVSMVQFDGGDDAFLDAELARAVE